MMDSMIDYRPGQRVVWVTAPSTITNRRILGTVTSEPYVDSFDDAVVVDVTWDDYGGTDTIMVDCIDYV